MTVKALPVSSFALWLLALVLLGYASCGPASAGLVPGPEFGVAGVSISAQSNQEYVDVCAGNGMYMAVWQDRRSGQDYDIYGILLDSNGSPISTESFLISKMPGGAAVASDQLYPSVGWNGTYFLVAWADKRAANMIPRIYATRVTTSGQVLDEGGIAFPTAPTPTDQYVPRVASNGVNWEVVWQEKGAGGSDDIYGIAVSSSGTLGARVAISYRADNEQWPAIAWNGTSYLVVWEDYRNSESTGTDIYGSQLTATGTKVANSERMISTTTGATGAPGAQSVPSVAAASTGMWLVVWQDERSGTSADIYCTRVSSGGLVQDTAGVAVSQAADDQEEPAVTWDGTYFLSVWRDKSANRGIRASRITTSGVPQDNPVSIAVTEDSAGAYGPAVAGRNGASLVAWYTLDMTDANVYGAKVSSAGQVSSLAQWSLCMQDQPQFRAAFDGTNYVIVWSDRRSGMYRVYAARISLSGTILDPSGVLVTAGTDGDQTEPAISWNGTNYMVVWTEKGSVYTDIKGMRLTTALTRVDTTPLIICNMDFHQNAPALTWSGTQWLVVWVDYRYSVSPNYYCDIRGARVSATGTVTQVTQNIAGADNNQLAPTVASIGGNFLVAWEDYRASGSPVIYCNTVSSTGAIPQFPNKSWDVYGVQVSGTTAWQAGPSMTTDGTNYFVTWSDKRVSWSNDNIYGQRLSVGTTITRLDPNDILICGSTSAQVKPSVAWNGANYLVAWHDARSSSTLCDNIYMNQLSPAGVVLDGSDSLISGGPQDEINPCVTAGGTGLSLVLYSNYIYATHRTAGRIVSQAPPTPVVTDDGAYSTVAGSLHAAWSVGARQSEVAEYHYAVGTAPGATNIVPWTSPGTDTQVTCTGLALVDGATYYFSVQAKNGAGTWGDSGISDGIIVDASAPTMPTVIDDGTYGTSSTSLHATWSSADPNTGVQEYRYAIGTSAGANDVVDWISAGSSTTVTKTGLSLIDGTTYYFSVRAMNAAGLWSATGSSDGILVDSTAPAVPTVTDDGDYSTSLTSLHATWTSPDPHSSIQEYQYAIGTSAGAVDVVDWTTAGTGTEVTKTGLTLTDGATYYISVKAQNAAGLWSGVGSSNGIMVDASAPSIPTVTDDGTYTTSSISLHATWTSLDPQSGIQEYKYCIGTSAGGTDVLDWTSTGTAAEVTKTDLSLTSGATYYFSVKAKNATGAWSSVGASDGIMVDTSAPTVPTVTDDGAYTTNRESLHAAWSSSDAQSGILEYRYAIGTWPGNNDVTDWTSLGTSTEVTRTGLSLTDGTAYCFSVQAKNSAGIWSNWGASDGIVVDVSAPEAPVVTDDGDYTSPDSIHATWTCSDPHSGIQEYKYAIGTSAGGTDVIDWTSAGTSTQVTKTGLSLSQGITYYVSVKAKNGADLWSPVGSSNGIQVSLAPPTTPVVTDDGDYTLPNILHATWTAQDTSSGIAEYQYAIGTSAGAVDVLGWTSASTGTEVTKTGLALAEGTSYFLSVKARNGAGLWSEVGSSNGITVPPAVSTIIAAKFMPDNTPLRMTGKIVTAAASGLPAQPGVPYFYIEEPDRVSGIKIVNGTNTAAGDRVCIAGKLEMVNGERQITASVVNVDSAGGTTLDPINMADRGIGGAALSQYTPGVYKDHGPNNLGLYIMTWGKVTYVGGAGENFFYANGGSFLKDGSGKIGVRIYCGSLAKPTLGSMVLINGISSCEPLSGRSIRRVLATQITEYR